MSFKSGIAFLLTICLCSTLQAQNDGDALRFSMLNYSGTARTMGMGNSFSALGADFSNLAINPAGIALYRKNELSISPLFSNRNWKSDYLGNSNSDNFFKFAFGNLGIVFTSAGEDQRGDWKNFSLGIGYNRTNEFSTNAFAEGDNLLSSRIDENMEEIDGTAPENIPDAFPYSANMPWQAFLIDTLTYNGQLYYTTAIPYAGTRQRRITETHGGSGEWDFTFGTTYQEKLYLGLTVGVANIRLEEDITWEEEDIADTIPGFDSYRWTTHLKTDGSGFNFKFGAIYRPADFIRFGAAIHTPTWYNKMTDEYDTKIHSDLDNNFLTDYKGPEYIPFEYQLRTPYKFIGSIGIIAGKVAAINAEYELTDYRSMKYRATDGVSGSYFSDVNKAIRSKYGVSHQVKLGAEFRMQALRFRVGANYSTTPFSSNFAPENDIDMSRIGLSTGFGVRRDNYFVDFGYSYSKSGSYLQPYTLSYMNVEGIKSTQVDQRFMFTVGWTF